MKEVMKRAWSGGIMLLFFIAAATLAVAQELPAVKQARQQMEIEQTNKAVATLTEAVKANPADASLLYYLGLAQIANGEKEKAEISFQKGLEVNPKEALNLAGKGYLRMLENNVTEAKTQLDQALAQTKSKNASVLKAVATAYLANDKFTNDALTLLQKAKSINSSDYETFILLGDTYTKLVKGGDAVSAFETASSLDPKNGTPQYKIGVVYQRSKNLGSAEEHFKNAIAADPNYALAYKELGELYYNQKKAADAVKAYEKYLSLTERPEPAKLRYAFFLFMAKDYKKANTVFEELSKRADVSATVYKYYAYSLVESGELAKSEQIFDLYFAKAPQSEIQASDYVYVAKMYQKQAKDSLAILNFKKSLTLEKNADIAQTVAETYYKQKKYPEAIDAYKELRGIKTKLSSQELLALGRSYYFAKKFNEADTTFGQLSEAQPTYTTGFAWRARSVANLDPDLKLGLAKPYFDKVVEIAEANPDKSKTKPDLIDAYSYLGYYYDTKGDFKTAKEIFEKLKAIDPTNEKAIAYLDAIKKAQQQQKKPKPQGSR
ncbi:MAG TPA: tetratricopeptide repeat protein [Ohtaekwangia sp.]|uniref:tetratricopeptide repeat protein n=1 Tax=Ohtaekwangia sp. TaxID=2066019 RepID=UPI002F923A34